MPDAYDALISSILIIMGATLGFVLNEFSRSRWNAREIMYEQELGLLRKIYMSMRARIDLMLYYCVLATPLDFEEIETQRKLTYQAWQDLRAYGVEEKISCLDSDAISIDTPELLNTTRQEVMKCLLKTFHKSDVPIRNDAAELKMLVTDLRVITEASRILEKMDAQMGDNIGELEARNPDDLAQEYQMYLDIFCDKARKDLRVAMKGLGWRGFFSREPDIPATRS